MDKVYVIGRDAIPQFLRMEAGEQLRMTFVALPGTTARLALEVEIAGPGCDLDLAAAYVCSGSDDLRMNVLVRHACGGSTSRQLIKGLAGGGARVEFDGLIYIAQDAQKTEAHQESHSILLSPEAKVEARPQLEIYADDVICSHGCTSGFLNAEEEFYMRSRGIPEEVAKQLQKLAFLAPVMQRLPEDLGRELYESIS